MSDYGMQLCRDDGSVMWDSRNVVGGVVAAVRAYERDQGGTELYPLFAGRSVQIIELTTSGLAQSGLSCDTALGYPRVSVTVVSFARQFLVVVF